MKLFIICDNLAGNNEWNSFVMYCIDKAPDVVCFSPRHKYSGGNPQGIQTWLNVIGSGNKYDQICVLGHGNINSIDGYNLQHLKSIIETVKDTTCSIELLACGTGDERQQIINQNGQTGFQAGNLVANLSENLTGQNTVRGLSVPLPFNPSKRLGWNPAQGAIVERKSY